MMDGIKEESVGNLFNLQVQIQENPIVEEVPADGVPGPGAPEIPAGASPALDAEMAGPDVRPVVPPQATPPRATPGTGSGQAGPARAGGPASGGSTSAGPARRGAHARGAAAPARSGTQGTQGGQSGQRGQRNQRNQRSQAGQGTQGGGGAHARPAADQQAPLPAGLGPRRAQRLQYSAPSVDGGAHVETTRGPASDDEFARVGRNDPCPCGSGRKYKRCHGDPRMRPDL